MALPPEMRPSIHMPRLDVVDDDASTNDLVRDYLKTAMGEIGVEISVKQYGSLREFDSLRSPEYTEDRPAGAIVDLNLEDSLAPDTFEAIRKTRENPLTHDMRIIVTSADPNPTELQKKALEAGADAFLARPYVNPDLVMQTFQRVFGPRKEQKEE